MKATRKDVPETGDFMEDLWKYMKAYLIPEDGDEYWDAVIRDAGRLIDKYKQDPIAKHMTFGFVDGLDEKWRSKEVKDNADQITGQSRPCEHG